MEIYILDSALRRTDVVEEYESMIWTDRFSAFGDFELQIDPSKADRALYSQGTYLACNVSQRVMYVDYAERKAQEDGKKLLVVKGKSLEAKLQDRPNKYVDIVNHNPASPLVMGPDRPGNIVRTLFHSICHLNSSFSGTDNFPYIEATTHSVLGDIPEFGDDVTIQSDIDNLYNTIKNICDVYNLGFRLIRPDDSSKLYFEVYTGFDRTSSQVINAPVVFSEQFNNLTDTTSLQSDANLKNVAFVFAPNGSLVVYGNGGTVSTAGFDRRILIVNASDITTAWGPDLDAQLNQRGIEELAKCRRVIAFDGQISKNSYTYGVDYMLGDLVEERDDLGFINQLRVTEQIFTSDAEGEKSYPTLSVDRLIVPGSWDALSPTRTWDSYTTETWDSMT